MALRRGQLVAVDFADHAERCSTPVKFTVYGRVAGITRTAISIDCWEYKNRKTPYNSDNVTRYTIVRSAIQKITRLVPHKEV